MIICKDCGHQNQAGDQFCGSCGSFLEWSGAAAEPVVDEVREFEPEHGGPAGVVERVKRAIGVDDQSMTEHRQDVRHQADHLLAEDQTVADDVIARRDAEEQQREAERRAASEAQARRDAEEAEARRTAAEAAARAAEEQADAARRAAKDQADAARRQLEAEQERQRVAAAAAAAEAERQVRAAAEAERVRQEAEAQESRDRAAAEAAAADQLAQAARQAEEQAEAARVAAQQRLEAAAAEADAAAARARLEGDAIAKAQAAQAANDAETARLRAELEAATAAAREEAARARAEAEAARAEAAALRASAQTRTIDDQLARSRADAAAAAEQDAASARRRAELESEAQRKNDEATAAAAAIRQQAEADAAAREAEAEAARKRAEAEAAAARAASEKIRQQAEAEAAQRAREEALRKASALIAKPVAASPASTSAAAPGAKPGAKSGDKSGDKSGGRAKGGDQAAAVPAAVIPTAAATPGAIPEARLPGRERERTGPKKAASRDLDPGDLICGQCGAGNPPTRKFCRRCGTPLVEAQVVKVGFFARIIRKLKPRKKAYQAGDRRNRQPGSKGSGNGMAGKGRLMFFRLNSNLLRLAGLLGILAIFGMGVEPIRAKLHLPNVRQTVIDQIRQRGKPVYDPVRPAAATASGVESGHGADQLIDLGNNTYWAATPSANGGVGSTVAVTFAKPFDLGRILLTSGVSGDTTPGKGFVSQPRPSEVRITLNGDPTTTKTLAVKDVAEPQQLAVKAKDVTKIELTVSGVYPAVGGAGKSVAITEMEFFQRRKFGDDFETLDAVSAQTSSAQDTAKNLLDGDLATAWVSDPSSDGVGQSITLTFPQPIDIDRIRIAPGKAADDFSTAERPKDLQLVFTCQGVCDATKQVRLPDKPGYHDIGVSERGVTQIVMQVRSVNGTTGGVAVADVQMQRKRPKAN